jgi:hypothetical protein
MWVGLNLIVALVLKRYMWYLSLMDIFSLYFRHSFVYFFNEFSRHPP